jgi:hypothetical protein
MVAGATGWVCSVVARACTAKRVAVTRVADARVAYFIGSSPSEVVVACGLRHHNAFTLQMIQKHVRVPRSFSILNRNTDQTAEALVQLLVRARCMTG